MLDPLLQALIEEQTEDVGLFVNQEKPGTIIRVQTQNSTYTLTVIDDKKVTIQGNGRYFNEPGEAEVVGSTWGGSMLKMNWVGVGMCMEIFRIRYQGDDPRHNVVTTSFVRKIDVIRQSAAARD